MKKISILGSTGKIGEVSLKILEKKKKYYSVYILSGYKNYKKIIYQIKKYKPKIFIIFDLNTYEKVKKKLKSTNVIILNEHDYLNYKIKNSNILITAIPGIDGLKPTLDFIKKSQKLLIANKESIICGWNLIKKESRKYKVKIIPIDSEHFSIMQILKNIKNNDIEKIFITASGGPFLKFNKKQIAQATPSQALKHPKWKMGKKISIDSATLMNKIFEVVEASKLFSINLNKIEILIHPQSLIHAIIKYKNGLSTLLYFEPDMTIPICNAISDQGLDIKNYLNAKTKKDNLIIKEKLEFFKVDKNKFPAIKLKPILNKFNSLPIVVNAGNEIFVDQFLKKKISFYSIIYNLFKLLKDPKIRKYAIKKSTNLNSIISIDKWARDQATKILEKK
tara:strand:+ start:1021 stop:2196 length:1176 start_codon:yes stop_codon:yes gene_type:complete